MSKAKSKAHTAERLANHLEDDGDLEAIKACSKCGRVYVFYANKADCPGCREGNLLPLSRYLPANN